MPLKGLSFDEIVKKEMDEGKPQDQAVAIAYQVTGKDKKNTGNHLTARERFDSLNARMLRGSQKYGSRVDEATLEEREISEEEVERKQNVSRKDVVDQLKRMGVPLTEENIKYEMEVQKLEAEGLTRSDAQGVSDVKFRNAKGEFEEGDKVTILMGNNAGRQGMITACQPYGNYDVLLSTGQIVSANGKDLEKY